MNDDDVTYWSSTGAPETVAPLTVEEVTALETALGQRLTADAATAKAITADAVADLECAIAFFVTDTIHAVVNDGRDFQSFFKLLASDPCRTLVRRDLSPGEFMARRIIQDRAERAGFDLETLAGGAWAGDFAREELKSSPERTKPKPYLTKEPLRNFVALATNIALGVGAQRKLPLTAALPISKDNELEIEAGLLLFVITASKLAASRGPRAANGIAADLQVILRDEFHRAGSLAPRTMHRLVDEALKTKVWA